MDKKNTSSTLSPEAIKPVGNLPPNQDYFLREPEVKLISGLCKETRRKMEKAGSFPKRVKLGGYAVGWRKSEIDAWMAGCTAQRDCHVESMKGDLA